MQRLWLLNLRLILPRLALALLAVAVGFALALLPLKWAVLLLAGGILSFGLLRWPRLAFCLLAFAVPFGSLVERNVGPVSLTGTELLVLLLLILWFLRSVAARRLVVPRPPLLLALLVFLMAILLSTLVTVSLELSGKEIVKWVEVLIVYLLMADMLDESWGRWVVYALLAAGSAEALFGIYQFLRRVGPEGFVLFGRFMRAYGHFAQPNPFAGYLGLTLPLAYALTLDAIEAWRTGAWRVQAGVRRVVEQLLPHAVAVAAFALMSVAMVMSWSRGGWVGAAAALLVVTVARSRTARVSALAVGLLLAYLLLVGGARYLPSALLQRVSDLVPYVGGVDVTSVEVNDANWAVIERMAHWQAAVGMFSAHPWLGVGIGNYAVAYPRYAVGRWRDPLGHAHNYYLNIAAEAGLVGLSAFVLLLTACFLQAWRVLRRFDGGLRSAGDHYWRTVALGALGVLVHLAVHSVFDNLFVHSMNVQLALVLGLLGLAGRAGETQHAHRD